MSKVHMTKDVQNRMRIRAIPINVTSYVDVLIRLLESNRYYDTLLID
jgi:hypothetical protein